jgi:hypothetical protein
MYPTITPLFPGVPKSENFLAHTNWWKVSSIHKFMYGGVFSNTSKKLGVLWVWEGERGGVPRFDDLIMYLHGFH